MSDGSIETHPLKMDPLIVAKEGPDSSALHLLSATSLKAPHQTLGISVFYGCHPT